MKEDQRKEMERMEELRRVIEKSPLTKQIIAEEADKILEERLIAAAKLRETKKEAETTIPELEAEIVARLADLTRHDEERKAVLGKVVTARGALAKEKQRIDYDMCQAETVLLSNYDKAIDNGIAWFQERREALLRKKPDSQTHKTENNMFMMVKKFVTFSNRNAITDALSYSLNAIRELEAMKLMPAPDTSRIEALKKGIPDIDEMEEITSEKPFPRIYTGPPIKSDSQLNWELATLNEKFKKVMARK